MFFNLKERFLTYFNKNLGNFQRYTAFTLAEVLITLGIIGIVAAMTIPTLMQKINEKDNVVALKKAYSELSSAYTLAVQANGTPDTWGFDDSMSGADGDIVNSMISPYLKVLKNCKTGTGCFPDVNYLDLNGLPVLNYNQDSDQGSKILLSDGSSILFRTWSGKCSWNWGDTTSLQNICGMAMVDVNGFKKPNEFGVDMFQFLITKQGLVPAGAAKQTDAYTFDNFCNKSKSTVPNVWFNGESCAAWVLYNENMDYLHCNDLSWVGKSKCS